MARTLDVYLEQRTLEQRIVGHLIQDDGGQMLFGYDPSWLENSDSIALSRSLPLREEQFKQKECRGFFGGILPEEGNRKVIAKILQISDKNDFAMLERIGGECAGALTFVPEGEPPPEPDGEYRELTDAELADILQTLPKRPLLAGEKGVRLSLAGAQDKIAVRVDSNGKISLPLHYAPSTHILKPAIATWAGVVSNETFCMALAQAVGLRAAKTTAHKVGEIEFLLSERYDRSIDENGVIHRLHQEDVCQALGIPSEIKYQAEGGPGLKECFALLRLASSNAVTDLRDLLDAVMFNLLIGNNDSHAKNYSVLYGGDGKGRLAPLYDLVCTIYYPEIENRLAMPIGGQANPDLVYPKEIEAFARDANLGVAQTRRRVTELAELVRTKVDGIDKPDETAEKIAGLIADRCDSVLSRFTSS
jgi:serine/threonine-protein kinase HipA